MEQIKKFFKNKTIVSIIAIVACIGILFFFYNKRINDEIRPIEVPFANREIPARTEITSDMIGTVKISSSMINKYVVTSQKDILGKFVNYNTKIPAGSLFYSSTLVNWEDMPDSAWSNIPNGHTIVSLPVNAQTTYGSSIYPGDKIDLYYQTYDSGLLVVGRLISGITVLAVKDVQGGHIFKKSANQKEAAALIFSVPEDLHIFLRQAMYLDGQVIPVPRNKNYNPSSTEISSEDLKQLIKSQVVSSDDIIDKIDTNENSFDVNPDINSDVNENVNNNTNVNE